MYIKPTRRWYDSYGTPHTGRQWFMLLVDPGEPYVPFGCEHTAYMAEKDEDGNYPRPRALVRKVALEQLGQFMMGYARAFNHRIICSGAYGNDGLIRTVPQHVYDKAVELPEEVYQAWAKDTTGWNSAGVSGNVLRQWALDNFEKLAPKGATLND